MMRLSEAARAISAERRGEDRAFEAVCTDTRDLVPRALFVALKGERFDGHDFLGAAAGRAAGALVHDVTKLPAGLPALVADDTRLALGRLAAYWRGKFAAPLVALTGSNGKTTVKEMLASILRAADANDAVLATRGNLNNDIGVPLTLLEIRPGHRYCVVEMGMNHAGEIRHLTRLAAPDVALITNAGPAHIGFFGSEEAIARAKGEIFEGLKAGGAAVINADDRHAALWRGLASGRRVVDFGIERSASVTATYALRHLESEIVVKTPLGEAATVLKAPGVHNVRNALAASAAAVALEVPAPAIAQGLARFAGIKGRLQKKTSINNTILIDDTYNANPESVRAAIDVLASCPAPTILVLGDMGELGPKSPEFHREAGAYARSRNISSLFATGDATRHTVAAFGAAGTHASSLDDLLHLVRASATPGATLLVKGSRFMQMERVVAALTGESAGAR
ncbi:MAG: UDP-N-acetylmuramoyl-tripeptide--D-alanyl-D-alanine ligase [Betaproteobacteria bacterium]|nr:UDP-N-acetylmuramoyl-tripeptide--D-alanyl-D-alanine ligase [Betaproteobacteria bacterium]